MEQKIPFYLAYQMPVKEEDEKALEQDYFYLRSLYPEIAKQLIPYIEDECEQLEYTGSMMYDEYPDPLQLRMACTRVFRKVKKEGNTDEDCLMELIIVMMYQEMCRRRQEYRHYKKRLYQMPHL